MYKIHRSIPMFLVWMMIVAAMLSAGLSFGTVQARTVQAVSNDNKTILDGVYITTQSNRGKDAFDANCAQCHGEGLTGTNGPPLKGDPFIENWREDNLNSLFDYIKTTMPLGRQKLTADAYLDILTYILLVNTFPPGIAELRPGMLGNIRFVGKDGPKPAPDNALIHVVGCLNQDPGGFWLLTNASEPARIRKPEKPTEEELQAVLVKSLGTQTFRLVYPDEFSPDFRIEEHKGHKMEGRGYLLINDKDQRISVTWLEMVDSTCTK